MRNKYKSNICVHNHQKKTRNDDFFFAGLNPPVWQMALEYLDWVEQYPCPLSYARGHLFKLFHHVLQIKTNAHIREMFAKGQTFEEFRMASEMIKEIYLPYYEKDHDSWKNPEELNIFNLKYPPYIWYIILEQLVNNTAPSSIKKNIVSVVK